MKVETLFFFFDERRNSFDSSIHPVLERRPSLKQKTMNLDIFSLTNKVFDYQFNCFYHFSQIQRENWAKGKMMC